MSVNKQREREKALQQSDHGGEPLRYESDQNRHSEGHGLSSLALVGCGDADDEEDDRKYNGDRGHHHDETGTEQGELDAYVGRGQVKVFYISTANGLWFPVSPPVSAAIWPR